MHYRGHEPQDILPVNQERVCVCVRAEVLSENGADACGSYCGTRVALMGLRNRYFCLFGNQRLAELEGETKKSITDQTEEAGNWDFILDKYSLKDMIGVDLRCSTTLWSHYIFLAGLRSLKF